MKKRENRNIVPEMLVVLYGLLIIRLIILKYPVHTLWALLEHWDMDTVERGVRTANLQPFRTIQMYIRYYHRLNSFENLYGNVLVFIPFGFLLPLGVEKMKRGWFFLVSVFGFILGIELVQLLTGFGVFDVDDILLNMAGAVLGYLFYFLVKKRRR